MVGLRYNAANAVVFYFVYAEANPKLSIMKKGMAELFKLAPSNLHKLVSGKKYHRGSMGAGQKASTLKELEEHGEAMVQCIRKKTIKNSTSKSATKITTKSGGRAGSAKSSSKITVMKTTPIIIPLSFLDDEIPASGMRGAHQKKKIGDNDKN